MSNPTSSWQPDHPREPGMSAPPAGSPPEWARQPQPPLAAAYPVPGGGYPRPGGSGPPPSNAGWAVAAVIFFWPLAFSAFTQSSKVFPLWMGGDVPGALAASERTKTLGKIALGIAISLYALFIVFYLVIILVVVGTATSVNRP